MAFGVGAIDADIAQVNSTEGLRGQCHRRSDCESQRILYSCQEMRRMAGKVFFCCYQGGLNHAPKLDHKVLHRRLYLDRCGRLFRGRHHLGGLVRT